VVYKLPITGFTAGYLIENSKSLIKLCLSGRGLEGGLIEKITTYFNSA